MNKCYHDLIPVYSQEISEDEENVVRWCLKCGSIVVDKDIGGKTVSGALRKIQTPENFR